MDLIVLFEEMGIPVEDPDGGPGIDVDVVGRCVFRESVYVLSGFEGSPGHSRRRWRSTSRTTS